jgi:hypothetical protein
LVLITAGHAATEILRRKQVRSSLLNWCEANGYQPAKHHRLLIEKLEAVARGEIERLAVFMPPGSAKSTYASILFPPWLLSQIPDRADPGGLAHHRAGRALGPPGPQSRLPRTARSSAWSRPKTIRRPGAGR